jgi:hypothetical protein
MRGARAIALAGLLAAAACSGAVGQAGAPHGGAAGPTAPPPPAPVTADALMRRTPTEGAVWVRLSVFRAHPLGYRVEPFVLGWLGWGRTIRSISQHPVMELDWLDIVGPKDPGQQRLMTRTAMATTDDAIDTQIAARADGTLRVVARPQPHLVAALPPSIASDVLHAFVGAQVADPQGAPDEALHVDFPSPHDVLPHIPQEVRHVVVRVFSRPGSAAEGFADMTCDDDASAARVADEVRARAEQMNGLLVRLVTRDLLSGLSVTTQGAVVSLRIPANAEQLASLATLSQGFIPPPEQQ